VAALATGVVLAAQAVFFISTDANGQVAIYNGIPFTLPGGVRLYSEYFVSGMTVGELSAAERKRLFNDQLRSQAGATKIVQALERGEVVG
jgi:hypothetical protein